jgi:uncharacterized protein (TIGR02596 family)
MNPHLPSPARRTGFTLIELLAVIAVIAIVIAFAVPAANQILRGSQVTLGSQLIGDQLGYARQLAVSKNRTIEVRFYRFGDPETPGEDVASPATGKWRGLQLFELLANGALAPAGPFQRLPRMAILAGSVGATPSITASTLLDENLRGPYKMGTTDLTAPEIPIDINGKKVGRNYEWVSFRFLADGSTSLPAKAVKKEAVAADDSGDTWYLTLIGLSDENKEFGKVNFAALQIDPFTGNMKTFRPGRR